MLEEEWVDSQLKLVETPPKEVPMCGELSPQGEGNIWEETVIVMVTGDHIEIRDPLTEEGTLVEDPLIEKDTLIEVADPLKEEDTLVEDPLIEVEDPLEEDILMEMEDPLEEEDTLVEDPLIEEEAP